MKQSSAKLNYIYTLSYRILLVITPLVTAPYLSRVIGTQGIGINSYTSNMANYFAMFGMLGLSNYGNRCIAKVSDDKEKLNYVFSSIYYLQIALCSFVTIAYIIYLLFINKDNPLESALQILTVLSAIINITWFYWGLQEFKVTVTRNIIIKLITVLCTFVFVREKSDVWIYVLILATGTFVGNIPFIILARKYVKLVRVRVSDVLAHIKPNLILFIPVLSVGVYRSMDKIMLGIICNYDAVGYYENADKILNICLGFITALGQIMLPKSTNLIASGKVQEAERLMKKSIMFSCLFCAAIVFGILGISNIFVPLFFGKEFIPSIQILIILAPNLLLLAIGDVLKLQYLVPQSKDHIYIGATILGAVVNILLNCILIPILQGSGAAIATLCAELISTLYIIFASKILYIFKDIILNCLRYFAAGLIMFIVLIVAQSYVNINTKALLVLIIAGSIIYFLECLMIYFRFKDSLIKEIMSFFKNIIIKKK